MPEPAWIKKTLFTSIVLALPALLLLGNLWWGRFQRPNQQKINFAFWIPSTVAVLYGISLLNLVLAWSMIYMVVWPVVGIILSVFGCGLAFSADKLSRAKLITANALLLILSVMSIVAPN